MVSVAATVGGNHSKVEVPGKKCFKASVYYKYLVHTVNYALVFCFFFFVFFSIQGQGEIF